MPSPQQSPQQPLPHTVESMHSDAADTMPHWFALRDLKRANALLPAFRQLGEAGIEVFTPLKWSFTTRNGKRIKREVAVVRDLLFAHDTRQRLDPIIAKTPTLQYRYKRGGSYCEPIVVPDEEMNRFIEAVRATETPQFYAPEELNRLACGQQIRIKGGVMDGYEGKLLTVRGSKTKRLVLQLPNLLAVSIAIDDEHIEIL